MDVSIVIVNWNTKDPLYSCLKSIYEQTNEKGFEVIVVDNASIDGSSNMVSTDFPKAIIIENSENRGYAAGVNRGIAIAKGRYVLVLNSDTIICKNAIEKTVRYADKHLEAAVIGCQVRENRDKVQTTCFRFPSLLNLFLRASGLARILKYNKFFGREAMLWWGRDSERRVDVVSGMFMLTRRSAIDAVGLMDETYFMYCEETDWCYRFAQAGWQRLFWPGARIIHVDGGSHSTDQVAVKMFVQKQKSLLIFIRKHRGLFQYWLGCLVLSMSFFFRVFIWCLFAASKRITGCSFDRERASIRKYWVAFRFCAFRCEAVEDS